MSSEKKKGKIVKNSALLVGGQLINIFSRFFSNIILAWFLVPEDFGIAALIATIFTGLAMLSDVGIQDSLVRNNRGSEPDFYRTAYLIQIARGLILYLIVAAIASPVGSFYGSEVLRDGLLVGGLSLIITGFKSVGLYIHQRNHYITPFVVIEGLASIVTPIIVIIICYFKPTVWALIYAHIITAVINLIGSYYYAPLSFKKYKYKKQDFFEIFHFGKWIFLVTFFHFLITQADKLVVGKLVDATTLGIYSISSALATITLFLSYSLSAKVVYPILSEAARQSEAEFSAQLVHVMKLTLPVLFVFSLGIFSIAPIFFELLYKDAYRTAGLMTQYLVIMTWFMVAYDIYQKIPVSFGMPAFTALASFINSVVRISVGIALFQLFGVNGFILGLAVGSIVGIYTIRIWMKRRRIQLSTFEIKLSLLLIVCIALGLGSKETLPENPYIDELVAVIGVSISILVGYISYKENIHGLWRKLKHSRS